MNFLLIIPFIYFYTTRLNRGSVIFHALFEWVAAGWIVFWMGRSNLQSDLYQMLLSYFAFISIYELGYIANDLYSANKELDGRRRGPQGVSTGWVSLWVTARLVAFALCTSFLDLWLHFEWWCFFASLAVVFALHNWLDDREFKISTFTWLAWLRFMAPVMFIIDDSQRMGIGLAVALGYSAFRLLGYMDSKGLLNMPGRRRPQFRQFFFVMLMIGGAALWPYPEAFGFVVLCSYWTIVAILGGFVMSRQRIA